LCRHTPKVGAVCPNWARTDLWGGRSVMSVPTAISETSSQIIPLKARADFPIRAEFRPWRPLAFELQGREYAARGTSSAFSCVDRARAQREEGLRARLRERGK